MQTDFVWSLLISLGLTLVLELVFGVLWGLWDRDNLWLLILINTATNPPAVLLNALLVRQQDLPAVPSVLLIETAVVLTEWQLLKHNTKAVSRPFLFALLSNLFSYGIGLLLPYFIV